MGDRGALWVSFGRVVNIWNLFGGHSPVRRQALRQRLRLRIVLLLFTCSSLLRVDLGAYIPHFFDGQDTGGTQEEAEGLVGKCLLQDVGGGGYRVHDLVLDFVKIKIKADGEMVKKATTLQAHFLGRLDVLKGYNSPEHGAGNQGLFVLDALWRSVEQLSGDPELEVASYSTSLGELESCEATTEVARSYWDVGVLFNIQVRHNCFLKILRCCSAFVVLKMV